MSKLTTFLNLLKGDEDEYFDYVLHLNNNWDKIDESVESLYKRDNIIYVNEIGFNANGNAMYKKVETDSTGKQIHTWWEDSLFRIPAKDNYSNFNLALDRVQIEGKNLKFPKGRYYISKELVINQSNVDFLFEKGSIIIGDVRIKNVKKSSFNNLTIEGNLTIDNVESCNFLNLKITGKTKFGATERGKISTLNHFLHCDFNSDNIAFELYCEDLEVNSDKNLKLEVLNNSFINCKMIGRNYGILSDLSSNVENALISHNLFINCYSESLLSNSTSVHLGKQTRAFNFIEQSSKGIVSINLEQSLGQHIFSGGQLNGEIRGLDKFLVYKPAVSNNVSFEKIGNNINNMRKLKVFNNEVPKWKKFNVSVSMDKTTYGFTGEECLKLRGENSLSYPTLERTFNVSEHLNQTINIIVRVKSKSVNHLTDSAIILTNGNSNDTVNIPIKTDDTWKVVSAKIEKTENKNVTIKLCPNDSYINAVNDLYIDWIVIALGDFVQLSSIPSEEHHYKNLSHYGDFSVTGNAMINGDFEIKNNFSLFGDFLGDLNVKDGNINLLKNTEKNQSANTTFDIGAKNSNSVNDLSTFKYKLKVEGDQNNQILKIFAINRQVINNTDDEQMEEILQLSKNGIYYKGKEIYYDGNSAGAGFDRPENPKIGRSFFDTALNKPIWYNGVNWVDALGTKV